MSTELLSLCTVYNNIDKTFETGKISLNEKNVKFNHRIFRTRSTRTARYPQKTGKQYSRIVTATGKQTFFRSAKLKPNQQTYVVQKKFEEMKKIFNTKKLHLKEIIMEISNIYR